MKVTYNWLKDFVDLDVSPEVLADKLTCAGMEVEEIIYQDKYLHHVVVGKIESIVPHPNAERLTICTVNIGSKNVQIVTAAKNIREGDLVPVSLPGADLANGIKIQTSKLRGELSEGMFCSGEELGITDEFYEGASVNGILILNKGEKVGDSIANALGLNDVVFDINITSNRPDLMSVYGIAKEVCAILKKALKKPELEYNVDLIDEDIANNLTVKVDNELLCPRYIASYVKDVNVEPSPIWIKNRLNAVGIKSINNIVDITNYVLIEFGQPMHAFDYKHLDGQSIIVRTANKDEEISVLNQNSYILDESMLCICDGSKPVVIAGIIGGLNSCVEDSSKEIVLEAASFDRASVRITSRKIGVRTDSTARFEKGVDILSPEIGMKRALNLISKLKAGKIVSGVIDVCSQQVEERKLSFSIEHITRILGVKISSEIMADILNRLDIKTTIFGSKLNCIVPISRGDIENDADIAEEIIRVYGYDIYDNVESKLLTDSKVTFGKFNEDLTLQSKLKNLLCSSGYYEALNYSLCACNACDKLFISQESPERNVIKISNPISEELACLRTTLVNSLLMNVANNVKRNVKQVKLFEIGKVYIPKSLPLEDLPCEDEKVAFVTTIDDFYTVKGVVEKLLSPFEIKYRLQRSQSSFLHPGISADILDSKGNIIGRFGQVHPKVADNYEIPNNTIYAEIDIVYLKNYGEKQYIVKPISKYPFVERDFAVLVNEDVTCEEILSVVRKSSLNLLTDAYIFDIYRSKNLENKKSVAFKVILSSLDKTFTDEEVNSVSSNILEMLKKKCGAELR